MRHRLRPATLSGLALGAGLLLLGPLPAAAQQMQMMPPDQVELIRGLLPSVVTSTKKNPQQKHQPEHNSKTTKKLKTIKN